MNESLAQVAKFLRSRPELAGYTVRQEGQELHLSKGSESFVRLIPTEEKGIWHMEHFRNQERWAHVDLACPLEGCLDYLAENLHYLFWDG
jgi:hypothetical protein